MNKDSSILSSDMMRPFEFPGLRSDIEGIERSVSGSIGRFFEAADAMSNEFFRLIDDPSLFGGASSSSSRRQEIPIERNKQQKNTQNKLDSGDIDISGLARDV
ncbi:Transcription factor FER-LIKE IRON DEFICIENCY-INDUCED TRANSCRIPTION FACTOR [Bienertia sinuspersici]